MHSIRFFRFDLLLIVVLTSIDQSFEHINVSMFQMPVQFSVESIDYLADKFNNCGSLSDESLSYLTRQATSLISILLQVKLIFAPELSQEKFPFRMLVKYYVNVVETV